MAKIIPGLRPNRPRPGARRTAALKHDHGVPHKPHCAGKHCYECGACICDPEDARCEPCRFEARQEDDHV